MKKLLLLNALLFISIAYVSAQSPALFNTMEYIDIANIKASHLVHGDMWFNPVTESASCEFPKGSGKHLAFLGDLWIAGFDAGSQLKAAAITYRTKGTDFWPGPVDTSKIAAQILSNNQSWAKIWKVNRSQLDSFKALTIHTIANTPAPILEWPAKGNLRAKGAGGAALVISRDMAPYVDANSDGHYDALSGDYPLIKGDQMLWWVINDAGHPHPVTGTTAFGIEVRLTAYAYKRNTIVDNVIFYEYLVANQSTASYSQLRLGFANDPDIGDLTDDYMGFDSSRRLGIGYNGKPVDGTGKPGDYGRYPPMAGTALLEQPGDAWNSYLPAGSFNFNENPNNPSGMGIYNIMHSLSPTGQPLPNNAIYVWGESDECNILNHVTGDRRFVLSGRDFNLAAGATQKFAMALVAADSSGGCPMMDFSKLHATSDTAYKYYWNPPPPPVVTASVNTALAGSLRIYPNPATDLLYVEMPAAAIGSLRIYDAIGKAWVLLSQRNGNIVTVSTSALPAGIYSIRYQDAAMVKTEIFIKE